MACVVSYPLERWAQTFFPYPSSRKQLLLECLLIPGVIEESVKLLVSKVSRIVAAFTKPVRDAHIDACVDEEAHQPL